MDRTILTPAQCEALKMFADIKSEEELEDIKHLVSEYYARKADEEMERLWNSGEWNEQTLADLQHAHFRTPYNQNKQ